MKLQTVRSMLYGLSAIFAIGLFGSTSEYCDMRNSDDIGVTLFNMTCGGRLHSIVAFAVCAAFFSLVLLIGAMTGLKPVWFVEMLFAPLIFVFWTVVVSLATSPRTYEGNTIQVHLAWWGEIVAFVLIYLVFIDDDRPAMKKTKAKGDIENGITETEQATPNPQEPSSTTESSARPGAQPGQS